MKAHLLLLLILISCQASSPTTSSVQNHQSALPPGTALSNLLIIDYVESDKGFEAKGVVKKTLKYGASTSIIAPNDTISLRIGANTLKSSNIEESFFIDNIHTGKQMQMLLKEQKKVPENIIESKLHYWEVLDIN